MKNIFCILILITFLASCKKEAEQLPHTIVEGYIIHSGTKQPLDSVRVSIWDGMPEDRLLGSSGNSSSGNYDTTYTNAQGFFRIEIDANEPVMFLYKKDYSFIYSYGGAALGIIPLSIGHHKDLKFEMDAPAWFRPKCYYVSFCNDNDSVNFSDYCSYFVSSEYRIGKGPHFLYYDFDSLNKGSIAKGDKYMLYWLKYQHNDKWHERVDSVYIKSFTTFTDTIYY